MTEYEKVMSGLGPMFKEAREKGLWFHCGYQDLWLSPEELEKEQAHGRFLWGACNWDLRNPKEHLKSLYQDIRNAQVAYDNFASKID